MQRVRILSVQNNWRSDKGNEINITNRRIFRLLLKSPVFTLTFMFRVMNPWVFFFRIIGFRINFNIFIITRIFYIRISIIWLFGHGIKVLIFKDKWVV